MQLLPGGLPGPAEPVLAEPVLADRVFAVRIRAVAALTEHAAGLAVGGLIERRLPAPIPGGAIGAAGSLLPEGRGRRRGNRRGRSIHGPVRLNGSADEQRLASACTRGSGRRRRLLPEQFLAFAHDPDCERDQCCRAQADRHVDEKQLAGGDPADEHPDGDDDQPGAEPDHL